MAHPKYKQPKGKIFYTAGEVARAVGVETITIHCWKRMYNVLPHKPLVATKRGYFRHYQIKYLQAVHELHINQGLTHHFIRARRAKFGWDKIVEDAFNDKR